MRIGMAVAVAAMLVSAPALAQVGGQGGVATSPGMGGPTSGMGSAGSLGNPEPGGRMTGERPTIGSGTIIPPLDGRTRDGARVGTTGGAPEGARLGAPGAATSRGATEDLSRGGVSNRLGGDAMTGGETSPADRSAAGGSAVGGSGVPGTATGAPAR
jgi:hypothetical protein